jgi:hypothetical protein
MADVGFSLTERAIVNPILYLRASPVNDPDSRCETRKKIWHVVESELIARVIAVFTSVVAASDGVVHLASGVYKAGRLLLGRCRILTPASCNGAEVRAHFREAAFFTAIAVVGSVASTIWPGVVKYFVLDSFLGGGGPPDNTNPNGGGGGGGGLIAEPTKLPDAIASELPDSVAALVELVCSKKECAPYNTLRQFWQGSTLTEKYWFVRAFNYPSFAPVRKALGDLVYSFITSSTRGERHVRWLNEHEISTTVSARNIDAVSKGFFFHATSQQALESILKSKRVEVRHEKAFRGAFVSTLPDLYFGPCVLVFKRTIERLSQLEHGFVKGQEVYWAGFSKDIPVQEDTLAYILFNSTNQDERDVLQSKCLQWYGRQVPVVLMGDAIEKIRQTSDLQLGIPSEWKNEGEEVGRNILRAMRLLAPPFRRVRMAQAATYVQRMVPSTSEAHAQPMQSGSSGEASHTRHGRMAAHRAEAQALPMPGLTAYMGAV